MGYICTDERTKSALLVLAARVWDRFGLDGIIHTVG